MIYVDSSVALAHLLGEEPAPSDDLWDDALVSSRLLEYEIWNRINARGLSVSHAEQARAMIGRFAFVELGPDVLARARDPFPTPIRTLDALHLASIDFLVQRRQPVALLTYDQRMLLVAQAMKLPIAAS